MARAKQSSSYSKKAQVTTFAGYVVASLGVFLGAILLIVSLLQPAFFSGLRATAGDAVSPAGEAGAVTRSSSKNIFDAISGYYRAGSKNAELQREVEVARVRLAEAEAVKKENERLKALLDLSETLPDVVANGRLIGSTSSSARRIAFLSVGRDDGVDAGMPVRSPKGLVGRILEAGSSSSRVLLLTDSESMVPVRRAKDEVVAFAEGRADGTLRLRLVNLGINPIEVGDVFVTSGAGGLYRPGIAVAVATELTRDGANARLLSDPASTDFVMVYPIWQPEVRSPDLEAADREELENFVESQADQAPNDPAQ